MKDEQFDRTRFDPTWSYTNTHTHLLPVSLREKEDDAGNSPFKDVITTSTLSFED
jgi:hypothetical protein